MRSIVVRAKEHFIRRVNKGERDIPIIADEHFYEINMGIWEGQTIADIEKQFPEEVHLFWNEPHLFSQHQAKILRPLMKE